MWMLMTLEKCQFLKKNRCTAFCFLFSFQSATSSEIHEISFSLIFKEIMWWEMFDALFLKDWILISKNHSPAPPPRSVIPEPKNSYFPNDTNRCRSQIPIRSTYCIKDSYRYDGTLHTDLWKSKTIREIKKILLASFEHIEMLYWFSKLGECSSNDAKWFFDFSTGFRFSKISVECSDYICSCPWLHSTH